MKDLETYLESRMKEIRQLNHEIARLTKFMTMASKPNVNWNIYIGQEKQLAVCCSDTKVVLSSCEFMKEASLERIAELGQKKFAILEEIARAASE